jgi:hypothetical protein
MSQRIYIIFTCTLAAATILLLARRNTYAGTTIPQKLVAHEFDLVNNRGKIIGQISSDHGKPEITLQNANNNSTSTVEIGTGSQSPTIVCSTQTHGHVTMTALGTGVRGNSMLLVFTAKQNNNVVETASFNSNGQISVHRTTGPPADVAKIIKAFSRKYKF